MILRLFMCLLLAVPVFAQQGLVLTLESGGEKHERVARQAALFVQAGEAPTPFLAPGPFTARWEGDLNLEKRSRLYFSYHAKGKVKLTVAGEVQPLEADEESGILQTPRLRLNSGKQRIVVEYQSPPDGNAEFRLYWQERSFARELIPPTAWTIPEGRERVYTQRKGRELVAEHGCIHCHTAELGPTAMPELDEQAPSFAGIGDRLTGAWMSKWLAATHAMRPNARMPLMPLEGSDFADIAAFLSGGKPCPPVKAKPEKAKRGGAIFHRLGCIACHDLEETGKEDRIGLKMIGHKYRDGALKEFLLEPAKHHPASRMPHFELNESEADELAQFLRSLHEPFAAPAAGDAAKGQGLVQSKGCLNCHDGLELKNQFQAPPFPALLGKIWTEKGCLLGDPRLPKFNLSTQEKLALATFGEHALLAALQHWSPAEYAERTVERLRCIACHSRDGEESLLEKRRALSAHLVPQEEPDDEDGAPKHIGRIPDLTFAGEKLNGGWMHQLFAGTLGYRSRPWLEQRMPGFPARAEKLARGVSELHGYACDAKDPVPKADLALGEKLTGLQGGFACINCHGIADQKPLAVFEGQGINLEITAERMRHEYYHRWMLNPQRIDPLSIMPRYVDEEGQSTLVDVLDGDPRKQFDAIWLFMQGLLK